MGYCSCLAHSPQRITLLTVWSVILARTLLPFLSSPQSSGAVWKSGTVGGGVPGSPSLIVLMVSVDVKQYWMPLLLTVGIVKLDFSSCIIHMLLYMDLTIFLNTSTQWSSQNVYISFRFTHWHAYTCTHTTKAVHSHTNTHARDMHTNYTHLSLSLHIYIYVHTHTVSAPPPFLPPPLPFGDLDCSVRCLLLD